MTLPDILPQAQIFISLYFRLQGRYKVQRRVFSNETSKFEWQDVLEVLHRMKTELQTFDGSKMERARLLHNYTMLLMYATVAPVSLMHKIFPFFVHHHFKIIFHLYRVSLSGFLTNFDWNQMDLCLK